jgi:hypothetical protein
VFDQVEFFQVFLDVVGMPEQKHSSART